MPTTTARASRRRPARPHTPPDAAPAPPEPAQAEAAPPHVLGLDAEGSILGANAFVGLQPGHALAALGRLAKRAVQQRGALERRARALGEELGRIARGHSDVAPDARDRRFAHRAWSEHAGYRRIMQTYLAASRALYELVDESALDWKDHDRAQFALSVLLESLAPTNALLLNPAALERAWHTRGQSLLRGLRQLGHDLLHNHGMPRQVDAGAFAVGGNIAVTHGAVVFRNEVLELIQYAPQTERVAARPVLILPPQINKYYILDLAPGRSVVEYLLRQGLTVFVVSWRNPTAVERDWDLGTYVAAAEEALDAARTITQADDVHLVSACAGGITAALLLGHLSARDEHKVATVTFLVTVLDTEARLALGPFVNETTVAAAIRRSRKRGVLDAADMARVFAWLRPNDLVWSYFVNNYLMGDAPPAFDVLFWNADSTRLPAALHAEFLSMFLENPLVEPGKLELLGTPISLRDVKVDAYVVAGSTDHITPWAGCYRTTALLGGKSEFVLSNSGHIQSIVNPPGNPRAQYYTDGDASGCAASWLASATAHSGSWWEHWGRWLRQRAGAEVDARAHLGGHGFSAIEPAPGRYVYQR